MDDKTARREELRRRFSASKPQPAEAAVVPLNLSAFITAFQSVEGELSIEHGNVDRELTWRNVSLTPTVALLETDL